MVLSPEPPRSHAEVLGIDEISWSGHQLVLRWSVDRLRFETALWYESVDFDDLVARHGANAVSALAFHVAMFEVNKGASFRPDRLEIAAPWGRFLTPALVALWQRVLREVWAQWRYEHELPDHRGPALPPTAEAAGVPLRIEPGAVRDLWFCGGGKDSLLAGHLLDLVGRRFDALAYSHSVYGQSERQHELIQQVIDRSAAQQVHRIHVYDSSMDLPGAVVSPYREYTDVLAAETPASLFAALPIAVAHGFENLLVAHERSANVGNLVWDRTGEDVNHQWGKSLEAERLLGGYIAEHLVAGVHYFSVLQPVYDALVFSSLAEIAAAVPAAHSCNTRKPWCKRCAKCAYVWICDRAWLPWEPVDEAFGGTNLLDLPENRAWYRQMLGLEAHTPFECIGQVDETRLAFAMAKARGQTGAAMDLLDEVGPFDWRPIAERYLDVDREVHRMPTAFAEPILGHFTAQASKARAYVDALLAPSR